MMSLSWIKIILLKPIWKLRRQEWVYVPWCYLKHKLKGTSYVEFYTETMDIRSKREPWWGREDDNVTQLEYNQSHGLEAQMNLLDYGCGALAAGRYFINYLEPGCYCGVDISSGCIEECRRRVIEFKLRSKAPNLEVIPNGDISTINHMRFDRIWAQSVLTHNPPEVNRTIICNMVSLLKPSGEFIHTYSYDANGPRQFKLKNYGYPRSWFDSLAKELGVRIEHLDDFHHPVYPEQIKVVRWSLDLSKKD